MRLTWSVSGATWQLTIRLEGEESVVGIGQGGREVGLISDECRVEFPLDLGDVSPDLRALAAVTVASPWLPRQVSFDEPVSSGFAEVLSEDFGIETRTVDDSLRPRSGERVGLSYSSGADSIACSMLLPDDTPFIHFRRTSHPRVPNRATHFRADVQAELVRRAGEAGREVYVVVSDLEYLVSPFPSFPEWVTVALPVILMGDRLDLGGVGFGSILGSRYLQNGRAFREPPSNDRWARLFDAAGLPHVRPTCGMSEVTTISMAAASDLAPFVRSCALGGLDRPCLNCKKCLRKELTTAALSDQPLPSRLLSNLGPSHPAVTELLEDPPYYFQHILEFGLPRLRGIEETFLATTYRLLGEPDQASTEWVTRYFPPALENDIPERFRGPIKERIERYVEYMTPQEERGVYEWDALERVRARLERSKPR